MCLSGVPVSSLPSNLSHSPCPPVSTEKKGRLDEVAILSFTLCHLCLSVAPHGGEGSSSGRKSPANSLIRAGTSPLCVLPRLTPSRVCIFSWLADNIPTGPCPSLQTSLSLHSTSPCSSLGRGPLSASLMQSLGSLYPG